MVICSENPVRQGFPMPVFVKNGPKGENGTRKDDDWLGNFPALTLIYAGEAHWNKDFTRF
jgi:hypothetical protein